MKRLEDEADAAGTQAGKTVEAVGADVQRLTAQTVPAIQMLVNDLSVLSASLRRLSEQTERNPASLLRGRGTLPDGPGESPLGQAAARPAIDAHKLAPAP